MNATLRTIFRRLREPSTLAGLGVLGVLFGLPPGTVEVITQAVSAVLAVGAIVIPESKPAATPAE